ncbi:IS110 family transposase [Deinococcus sp. QL22]|uniref:IS110 family transposase n=1 Tax=Deinococcus sp. QL22 TaxID=2939437 RepID=UPI0020176CD7|nr:IS110 family transposase [Deinococcus sp. QL22]UQN07237.1 IS110 family transposase [Deinococcus sp. QL22]
MIILGLDPHPTTHTAVALDSRGLGLDSLSVQNDAEGLNQLCAWSARFELHCWAIEGAGNRYVAPLLALLFANDQSVSHIHPSLTRQYRARRGKKKNDLVDAENVARVLLANPQLPPDQLSEQRTRLQELSRTRDKLAQQRKANQMMLEALPDTMAASLSTALQAVLTSLEAAWKEREHAMATLVAQVAPTLLTLQGIGVVLAGTVLAEMGDIQRFENVHHFASDCGAAPVERGSGKNTRWCVNVGGHRQLNPVLHLMALTRRRCDERTKTFVAKKEQEGKTKRAALRALKTHLARELYRTLHACHLGSPIPAPS